MTIDYIPKFLEDEKYAEYDLNTGRFKLTEEGKRNKEVVESFNEFYKEMQKTYE